MVTLRSLPVPTQFDIRERAMDILRAHQGAGIMTMLEAVTQARRELRV